MTRILKKSGLLAAVALMTAMAQGQPLITSVVSGGFTAGIAPGSSITLFGNNLAAGTCTPPGGTTWQITFCNSQILVNSSPIPVGFVSPGQINAQIPFNTVTGNATIQVVSDTGSSPVVQLTIVAAAPVLAANPGVRHSAGFSPANAATPAVLGAADQLTVFGFGFGPTNPAQPAGVPATPPLPTLVSPPTLYVDGASVSATFLFAGLTTGTPGLYQFDFTINSLPNSIVARGTHTLSIGSGGVISNGLSFFIQGPDYLAGGVLNGFTFQPTLAAGGLSAVYGMDLASGTCTTPAGQHASTTLCDAQVLVNNAPVPLIFASPTQINFQLPFGIATQTVSVQVKRPATNRLSVVRYYPVQTYAPGLGAACGCGSGLGMFFKASNGSPVSAANPAVPGETLNTIAGGLGPTNPPVAEGIRAPAGANTTSAASVFIDGVPALVTSSALQPFAIGQYAVSFVVPAAALAGTKPLVLSIAGSTSQAVEIPIAGGLAWVANNQGIVNTIDTFTNTVIGAGITVHNNGAAPFATPANSSRRLALTPDGTRVYVAPAAGYVWVIDTKTRAATQLNNVPPAGLVIAISPDGKRGYQRATGGVAVFDTDPFSPTYHQPLPTIPSIPSANRFAFSPDGTRMYVGSNATAPANGSLAVVDILPGSPTFHTVIARVTGLGSDPRGLAVTPDGKRVYAINGDAGTISTINTTTNTEVFPRIIVGGANENTIIAITADGKRAYVDNLTASPLTVIDIDPSSTNYNQVLTTLATGPNLLDFSVSADSSKVYTVSPAGNSVRVVDTVTNALGASITITGTPTGIALRRPLNTALGTNAVAKPIDATGGNSPVNMTYSNVTSGGTTTLTTTTSAPPAPAGFQVAGTTYNIATTATFSGPVTVCIGYNSADFPLPAQPKLLHYEGNAWVDVTTSVDTVQHIVCGTVSSLSPFALAKPDATPPLVSAIVSPPANASGWHKTDPSVVWNTSDPESGIGTLLGCINATQSTETPGSTLICTATNGAGSSTGPVSVSVKLDKTAPNPPNASVTPAPDAAGWNRTNVSVAFAQAGDAGGVQSGVANCSAGTTVAADTSGMLVQGICTDIAGNNSAPAAVMVRIDRTAPTVSGTRSPLANGSGWNNSNVTVAFTCADALSGVASGPTPANMVFASEGAGQGAVSSCTDIAGNTGTGNLGGINIDRTTPVLGTPAADPAVVPLGSGLVLSVMVSDALSGVDAVAYNVDGGVFSNAMTLNAGKWSAAVAPLTAGLHTLCVQATDKAGNAATNCIFVPVYDGTGGFVTGGGWIESPAGAYTANLLLAGKGSFGFVARYEKGANVPSGDTQFEFRAGGLDFVSTGYEWLVVAGARAQFKGSGKINGAGNYAFLLTAIDGDLLGVKKGDAFRIKILASDGAVVYDNQRGKSDTGDDATSLAGGSIVIHKP